jgi:hypothetical protein
MDRITAIKESLATFVCGVLSLVPGIGLLPAIYVLANSYHLRRHCHLEWNPAEHYLRWGVILAVLGIAYTGVLSAAVTFYVIARQMG